jgi:zinc/manganese transport system permease protein
VATGPLLLPVLAAVFGVVSAVGGILLAVAGTLPVSPYITTLSFTIYVVCWIIQRARARVRRTR